MRKLYIEKCSKDWNIDNIDLIKDYYELEIFKEKDDRYIGDGYRYYVDYDKIYEIIERIINDFQDSVKVRELNNINIYLNVDIEFDKGIYNME